MSSGNVIMNEMAKALDFKNESPLDLIGYKRRGRGITKQYEQGVIKCIEIIDKTIGWDNISSNEKFQIAFLIKREIYAPDKLGPIFKDSSTEEI